MSGTTPSGTPNRGTEAGGELSELLGGTLIGQSSGAEVQTSTPAHSGVSTRDRYLQVKPLKFTDLPHHADFGNSADSHVDTSAFLSKILKEVTQWDATRWKHIGVHQFPKQSSASGIEVEQLTSQSAGETWFARSSKHTDQRPYNWETFDYVLRRNHSKHEKEYTPNIFDEKEILSWDGAELDEVCEPLGFKKVTMSVTNMYHEMPSPLYNRVFTVLVLSCRRTVSTDNMMNEFIVLQLPVDLTTFPDAIKQRANHHSSNKNTIIYNPPRNLITKSTKPKLRKKLVPAEYASVEKVTRMQHPGAPNDDYSIENHWTMSTTSNIKSAFIPKFLQDKMVPREIVKDVEFVYDFVKRRHGEFSAVPFD